MSKRGAGQKAGSGANAKGQQATRATGTAADRPVTPELVRSALASIPPGIGHDERVRVAFAVFDGLGSAGADLFLDWAGSRDKPDAAEDRATWRSCNKPGRVKVGTLFGIAKDHGWRFPDAAPGQTAVDTAAAKAAARARQEKHAAEEAELQRKRDVSAARAQALWAGAALQPTGGRCAYLERKRVKGHGLRYLPGGTALVPMRDEEGKLWSVQRLLPKPLKDRETGELGTDKLYGPPKASPDEQVSSRKLGLWHWIGAAPGVPVLLLAEGYATGATLHEATGRPVAVCFDAGNLVHVAKALRTLYPAALLLVCGDDDKPTEQLRGKNPGRLAATAAAFAVHSDAGPAAAVFPADLAEGQKDFNDLASTAGLDAVREQIEAAIAAPARPEAPKARQRAKAGAGGPNAGADLPAQPDTADEGAAGLPSGSAGQTEPDRFGFMLDGRGVWFVGRDKEGERQKARWLCAQLHVLARTRDEGANGWGRLLQFLDPDGNAKSWAMPDSMLTGDGGEWAGRLRDMGLQMAHGTVVRNLVGLYINTREPEERVTCVDRVGWWGGVYVLPSGAIGESNGRRFVFQSEAGIDDTFRRNGKLEEWQRQVAALCVGNSRLVFALCAAFAGPVLRFSGLESGGFNFRADSRAGKTTGLLVAASVWGRPSYMQRWRTTDNALEATAVQHCDGLLILDEFGQLDPRVAGECAYMLANEQEKGRATRGGLMRKRRTWRLLFLSSGEVGLADQMAEAGKRVRAGQEVRMVDVPLDAGAGMGGLEVLHEHDSPAGLSEAITAAAARVYGNAGRAWLEWCAAQNAQLPERLAELIERYRGDMVPEAASGQVRTVGSRFALLAAAGELATEAGITGWPAGEAARSVRRCFEAWLATRGHIDNGEEFAMLRQVKGFIEKNGEALFTWMHRGMDDHKPNTPYRVGFKRMVDDKGEPLKFDAATDFIERRASGDASERNLAAVEYLMFPEQFRTEVCKGFDAQAVAKLLRARGCLKHERNKLTNKQRLPGTGKAPVACYHLTERILELEL
jgi:putative DNA primase/helicase